MFYNAIIYYCNNCQFSFLRCHKLHLPLSLAVWGYTGPTHNTFQLYTSTQRLRSTRTLYHTYSTQGTRPRRSNITHHKHTKHGTGVTPAQHSTLHSFMQSYTSTQWFRSQIHHVIHTAHFTHSCNHTPAHNDLDHKYIMSCTQHTSLIHAIIHQHTMI